MEGGINNISYVLVNESEMSKVCVCVGPQVCVRVCSVNKMKMLFPAGCYLYLSNVGEDFIGLEKTASVCVCVCVCVCMCVCVRASLSPIAPFPLRA